MPHFCWGREEKRTTKIQKTWGISKNKMFFLFGLFFELLEIKGGEENSVGRNKNCLQLRFWVDWIYRFLFQKHFKKKKSTKRIQRILSSYQ